ncbi:MAG: reductive dehalogenase, partial [Bacteroidota bacterium]
IKADLELFYQKNDIFNRAIWDGTVKAKKFFQSYDITNFAPKKSKGFDHWDYAFRNASWHMTDLIGERHFPETGKVEGFTDYYQTHTPGPPNPVPLKSTAHTTRRIKQAAEYFGSGMTGICRIDQRWV